MLVTSIDGGAVHRIALADDLPAGRASAAVSGAGRHLVLPYQRSDALGTVIGLVDERGLFGAEPAAADPAPEPGRGLDDLQFGFHPSLLYQVFLLFPVLHFPDLNVEEGLWLTGRAHHQDHAFAFRVGIWEGVSYISQVPEYCRNRSGNFGLLY